jgi:uncharacterized membrane-anchored protein YhcB (DUF1043 family)
MTPRDMWSMGGIGLAIGLVIGLLVGRSIALIFLTRD